MMMTLEDAIKELSIHYVGDSYRMREAKDIAIEILKRTNEQEKEHGGDYHGKT